MHTDDDYRTAGVKVVADPASLFESCDMIVLAGLNVCKGQVTYKEVAGALGYTFVEPMAALDR